MSNIEDASLNIKDTKSNASSKISKLRGYRVMCGFTQEDMAKALGKTRELYSYKENEKRAFMEDEKTIIFNLLKERMPTLKFNDVFTDFE